MLNRMFCIAAVIVVMSVSGARSQETNARPVVVLTAFGSTVPSTQKTFDFVDSSARERFKGCDIRWAFTSSIVIRKLKENGIVRHNLDEVIADLHGKECSSVSVQSLHIVPGQEYTDIAGVDFKGLKTSVGRALMSSSNDITRVISAIAPDIKPGLPNVIVCHGNSDERYNVQIKAFAQEVQGTYSNVVVVSVEGELGVEGLKRAARMVATAGGQAHFIPLMLVAGDHIDNDVMGEGPESWKNVIGAKNATMSRPLGENEQILAIFWDHLETAISKGEGVESVRPSDLEYKSKSQYAKWKLGLTFWPRKLMVLVDLLFVISLGVIIGQMLDSSGLVNLLAVITLPITKLGKLAPNIGAAFITAFQSGAAANSMLVTARDSSGLSRRELYVSVLVISCISLFAHLPSTLPAVVAVLGVKAALIMYGVRCAAIFAEIIVLLLVSRVMAKGCKLGGNIPLAIPSRVSLKVFGTGKFWRDVWKKSKFTLKRVCLFMIPTFILLVVLEKMEVFQLLVDSMPWVFKSGLLPPQAAAIIPAQAMNLYNGAMTASVFLDSGVITLRQAILILLAGTMITAPIRTFKHAMPTYVAVLGARMGATLAVTAQVLRCVFLLVCMIILVLVWR